MNLSVTLTEQVSAEQGGQKSAETRLSLCLSRGCFSFFVQRKHSRMSFSFKSKGNTEGSIMTRGPPFHRGLIHLI